MTVKIGLNGLDPDSDQNKHRINLEWVAAKIGIKFKPRLFRLYLDQIQTRVPPKLVEIIMPATYKGVSMLFKPAGGKQPTPQPWPLPPEMPP